MFILASILSIAITAGIGAWLGTRRTQSQIDHPWDIPRVAQTFTTIVGTLRASASRPPSSSRT
jgi:hypothetical protein